MDVWCATPRTEEVGGADQLTGGGASEDQVVLADAMM